MDRKVTSREQSVVVIGVTKDMWGKVARQMCTETMSRQPSSIA
jgi:hypothetical protein